MPWSLRSRSFRNPAVSASMRTFPPDIPRRTWDGSETLAKWWKRSPPGWRRGSRRPSPGQTRLRRERHVKTAGSLSAHRAQDERRIARYSMLCRVGREPERAFMSAMLRCGSTICSASPITSTVNAARSLDRPWPLLSAPGHAATRSTLTCLGSRPCVFP